MALVSMEREALEHIWRNGGQLHILRVAGCMGITSNYARTICNSLGRADYIDLLASGWCKITPKGLKELRKMEIIKEEER